MNRMVMVMVAAIAVLSVFSGIGPVSMKVWFIEMIWAWGLVGVLALTWTKFRFSMMSYSCFFVWCVLQIIGAHWTFECVPMGWLMEPLGLSRNPFDRIAHFAVGFFAFPLAELFWRNGSVSTRTGAAFFAVMTTVAMAGLWEIVEWLYAAFDGGNAGAAFLGSQGDEWDAQKDILCDTLGALCVSVLFLKSSGRIGEIHSHVRVSIMAVGIILALPLFAGVEGSWSGTLDAMGQKLQLVFHIKENKCTLDSPDQGTFGIVGKIMSAKEMNMELLFKSIGGRYSGKIEEGRLCGMWKQGGMSFPLNMERTEKKAVRPQEPKPPFPYTTEDVVFSNAEARLSGTLTLPERFNRKTPAVVMVTGSGPQNRDEELFGHRPFAVIADCLARHGVASLRYDDRGYGKSVGKLKNISIENIALDAESGADWLRSKFYQVGVLGHSEGGTVGFMLGQRGKVDFIVSLAGSSLKLKDVLDWQLRRKLKILGRNEQQMEKELLLLKKKIVKDDGIRRYMEYDPIPAIKDIRCPVFVLHGEKDTQVAAKEHLEVFSKNISPNIKVKTKSYPGLNHMFQPCLTGEANEYAQIEQTISPEVLSDIIAFIQEL